MVQFVTIAVGNSKKIPPPTPEAARFPLTVLFASIAQPLATQMPPPEEPTAVAEFPRTVQFVTVNDPPSA
jgi:hypothetical protein